ncbi:MAG: hypothetical protein ACYTGG_13505 [Planctomycetota bacterium]|jgi:hypothetical protein
MSPVAANSTRALLEHLIDYAGLFPPAALDMEPAVRNFGAYLESPDAWLLGRLIVPVARLDEFEQHAAGSLPRDAEADPWRISALTVPAGDERLVADLDRIATFNEHHAAAGRGRAVIDVIELRGRDSTSIETALDRLPDEIFPFFELPIEDDPRGLIATLVGSDAGAKVRTGGVTADLYPKPEHLARFIAACAAADVPFKATAGLHHPLRHHSEAVGADEFGFLNVFIGAALAWNGRLDAPALEDVLTETSPDALRFEPDGLAWCEHRLTCAEIEDARLSFAVSFGSCSFDEPREDLVQLELL